MFFFFIYATVMWIIILNSLYTPSPILTPVTLQCKQQNIKNNGQSHSIKEIFHKIKFQCYAVISYIQIKIYVFAWFFKTFNSIPYLSQDLYHISYITYPIYPGTYITYPIYPRTYITYPTSRILYIPGYISHTPYHVPYISQDLYHIPYITYPIYPRTYSTYPIHPRTYITYPTSRTPHIPGPLSHTQYHTPWLLLNTLQHTLQCLHHTLKPIMHIQYGTPTQITFEV